MLNHISVAGMLQFRDSEADVGLDGDAYAMPSCILVPGPKHMLQNIIGDILAKLENFSEWQTQLKACTASLHKDGWVKSGA